MSLRGQIQKSGCSTGRSALPSITDIVSQACQVRKVPKPEVTEVFQSPRRRSRGAKAAAESDAGLERYQCQVCDAVFGPQKYLDLPEEFVSQDYVLLYTHYAEINSTENEIRTFRSLDPKPGGLYLNWGCGTWSETIPRLRADGFDVWGFEPAAPDSNYIIDQEFLAQARRTAYGAF